VRRAGEPRAGRYSLGRGAKKEILGLIFKKIMLKNLPRLRSAQAATGRIVPFWYAPFDKIISEPAMSAGREENLKICRRHHKNRAAISSKPMAAVWESSYHKLKQVLERLFKAAL